MTDKVKNILRELLNEKPRYVSFDKGYAINLEPFAVQICQLFPKSAENPDGYEPKPHKHIFSFQTGLCECGESLGESLIKDAEFKVKCDTCEDAACL